MTSEVNSLPDNVSRQRFRTRRRVFAFSLLIAVIGASIWFSREMLLRRAAEQWIVSDNIGAADAAVIFGGGLDTRPFAAAEYYRNGLVHKIVIANVRPSKVEALGILPSHAAINRDLLIKLGIPETVIETFGYQLSNTYEEAAALRGWVARSHAKSLIVPTDVFSSRRVRWVVTNALAGTGTAIQIDALDLPEYNRSNWWKTNLGLIAFQNEVMKYVYYRLKY
jgi:uncharacterized SAM-binding protein YcdF (DUF218 family)